MIPKEIKRLLNPQEDKSLDYFALMDVVFVTIKLYIVSRATKGTEIMRSKW